MVIAACQRAAAELQQPDLGRLGHLRSRCQQLTRSIESALRDPGESPEDQEETRQFVRQLRQERSQAVAEIGLLEAARDRPVKVPTREEILCELNRIDQILVAASRGRDVEQQGLARAIIELVTGGRIDLKQCGQRVQHHCWLEGRFQCDLAALLAEQLAGRYIESPDPATTVVIEYREPSVLDEQAHQARGLFDQGVLNVEIARRLKCSKSRVTRLLKRSFETSGEVKPDGRKRRSQLAVKHSEQPLHQRLAGRVMELAAEGMLLQEIAVVLKCDRNTAQAIRYWHTSRGLPVPDGRTRRKSLNRQGKKSTRSDGDPINP